MTSPNTAFTTQVLTSAQMNNLPFGVCGLQTLTSSFATSATHTNFQDDGLTLTITEISGRRYKITALENPYPNAGLQGTQFALVRGASTLRQWTYSPAIMDTGVAYPAVMEYVYTSVGSGSATYKMKFAATTANTTVTTYGDGSFPRQFFIEDIGSS
jgi:hypothetical protein